MNIAQRLKELRKERKLTQKEVAEGIGTKQTIYARYERNANQPSIETVIKLCKFYHVSADYILGLSENSGI